MKIQGLTQGVLYELRRTYWPLDIDHAVAASFADPASDARLRVLTDPTVLNWRTCVTKIGNFLIENQRPDETNLCIRFKQDLLAWDEKKQYRRGENLVHDILMKGINEFLDMVLPWLKAKLQEQQAERTGGTY